MRFGGVIKGDLGRKSGGRGYACVLRIRERERETGKAAGITLSLGYIAHEHTHTL